MNETQAYTPVPLAVDTGAQAFKSMSGIVGGFLAKTAGTLSLTINGTVLLTAQPVAVGWNPLPFSVGAGDGVAATAGGAGGVLAIL